jgi:hypothetical protein
MSNPLGEEDGRGKRGTRRNPGVQKQFLEPEDKSGMTPLRKNNFLEK